MPHPRNMIPENDLWLHLYTKIIFGYICTQKLFLAPIALRNICFSHIIILPRNAGQYSLCGRCHVPANRDPGSCDRDSRAGRDQHDHGSEERANGGERSCYSWRMYFFLFCASSFVVCVTVRMHALIMHECRNLCMSRRVCMRCAVCMNFFLCVCVCVCVCVCKCYILIQAHTCMHACTHARAF
jgi:hypothetical protein